MLERITKEINNLINNIEKESEQYRAELQRLKEVHIEQTTKNVKKLLQIIDNLKEV